MVAAVITVLVEILTSRVIKPRSPSLQMDSLSAEPPGKPSLYTLAANPKEGFRNF